MPGSTQREPGTRRKTRAGFERAALTQHGDLGLYTTRQTIEVESEPGAGATSLVRLPRDASSPSADGA